MLEGGLWPVIDVLGYGLYVVIWRTDSPKLDESLLLGGLCGLEEIELRREELRGVDTMVGEYILGCFFGLWRL